MSSQSLKSGKAICPFLSDQVTIIITILGITKGEQKEFPERIIGNFRKA